jgi:hypothetical protein
MFLLPLAVAAAGAGIYEIAEAVKITEIKPDPKPTAPLAAESSALVVFGDNSHPGINQALTTPAGVHWSQVVSETQLADKYQQSTSFTQQAINLACRSAATTLPFGQEAAYRICLGAVPYLIEKSAQINLTNVKNYIGAKFQNMVKRNPKTKMPTNKQVTKMAQKVLTAAPKTKGMYSLPVSAPVTQSRVIGRAGPPKTRLTKRGMIVTHQELVNTLTSSANAFNASSLVINPGKAYVFPWLSTIATNYDKYRMLSMSVTLNPHLPTTTAGKMGIAFDPDSSDDVPSNRSEFFAMVRHVEGPVWQAISMAFPLDRSEKFVNTHSILDNKLVDCGQITLFTDLLTSAVAVCDVIVEYSVELIDPQPALFSTAEYDLDGLTFAGPQRVTAFKATFGINLADLYFVSTASAVSTFNALIPAGTYQLTWFAYDSAGGTPQIKITNNTVSTMYYRNSGTTASHFGVAFLKVLTSPSITNPTVGEFLTIATASVGMADLESFRVIISRITPKMYNSGGGTSSLAAGATSTP